MADKIKKLSEAIRLGATFRPQCQNVLFGTTQNGLGSCALGAAAEASGIVNAHTGIAKGVIEMLSARFPQLESVRHEIIERNDARNGHRQWTREQIADWLEAQGL